MSSRAETVIPSAARDLLRNLVIQGDQDTVNPLELSGRKTVKAIPGSQLKVYAGAPHGPFITDRDRFNSDHLAFVRG